MSTGAKSNRQEPNGADRGRLGYAVDHGYRAIAGALVAVHPPCGRGRAVPVGLPVCVYGPGNRCEILRQASCAAIISARVSAQVLCTGLRYPISWRSLCFAAHPRRSWQLLLHRWHHQAREQLAPQPQSPGAAPGLELQRAARQDHSLPSFAVAIFAAPHPFAVASKDRGQEALPNCCPPCTAYPKTRCRH